MTFIEKINRILSFPETDYRLRVQLRYIIRVSKIEDGKYDQLIESVCDKLLEKLEVSQIINDEITNFFEEELSCLIPAAKEYTIHMVGHAHIDMNWMWGFNETVNITLDTFRTVLRLMEEYPDFTFSQSQASTYEICEKHDPDLFEAIVQKVKEGRWEVSAATWTEADKNLPCGESHIRHNLYTKQYFNEKFGISYDDLCLDYEPDTFGHPISVPEILKNANIKYYYHCRGHYKAHSYIYRAPSGAEILCYQDPYFYANTINEFFYEVLPDMYAQRGTKTGLYVYGVGDHGGGPTRRDIEIIKKVQGFPLSPNVKFSSYKNFFTELEKDKDNFPVVDDERNFIFTGCYSSQSEIKTGNRITEDRLYTAEVVSALSNILADTKPRVTQLTEAWKKLLFNQFHDILPGSCVRESRHHAMGTYQEALGLINGHYSSNILALANCIDSSKYIHQADNLTRAEGAGGGHGSFLNEFAFHTAAEYGRGLTRVIHVFNSTPYDRDEVTQINIWDWHGNVGRLICENTKGESLNYSMKLDKLGYWGHELTQLAVRVKVPAYGVSTLVIREGELKDIPTVIQPNPDINVRIEIFEPYILENNLIKAEFDEQMCLTSLIDKSTGKNYVNGPSGYFEYILEHGAVHMPNAWSEGTVVVAENMNKAGRMFVDDGGVRKSAVDSQLSYTLEYKNSNVRVEISLPDNSPMLKFNFTTDWHEDGYHRKDIPALKFYVPLAYSPEDCWYDIPMGTINRAPLPHDIPARGFAFAPDKEKGVALMCDTQGAYRCYDDTLSVTLLRATSYPDTFPEYGRHSYHIQVGILPCDKKELFKVATCFVQPLPFVSVCPHKGTLPTDGQFMNIEGNVIVSAVKTPENSNGKEMIMRFYSISAKDERVKLSFAKKPVKAYLVDTMERPIGEVIIDQNDVLVDASAFSITAIRVEF